jgi:hypothetical protein
MAPELAVGRASTRGPNIPASSSATARARSICRCFDWWELGLRARDRHDCPDPTPSGPDLVRRDAGEGRFSPLWARPQNARSRLTEIQLSAGSERCQRGRSRRCLLRKHPLTLLCPRWRLEIVARRFRRAGRAQTGGFQRSISVGARWLGVARHRVRCLEDGARPRLPPEQLSPDFCRCAEPRTCRYALVALTELAEKITPRRPTCR